jgi:acetyltransferase-like isoleucine patch superfamily enzyme
VVKDILKGALNLIAIAVALPGIATCRVGTLILGPERGFQGWSQAFSLLPGLTGVYLRRAFYRAVLRRCAADAWIGFGTVLSHPSIEIGRGVYVGAYCCLGEVTLGDDVLLGSNVSIVNGGVQHGFDRLDIPIRDQPGSRPRVTVGPDSWIGERATVMADVGAHCVIGAASLVTRPVPDRAIAVGVPARVVRYRGTTGAGAPPPVADLL